MRTVGRDAFEQRDRVILSSREVDQSHGDDAELLY
jgi:hypothetical protein